MNGCAVLNARSAHEQLSRVQEVLCDSLKRLTEDKNQLPRKVRNELTRMKTCMDAQAVALAAQKKSIAKIHDAGPSSYVHDVLDVHRKRTEREVSAQEPGHDNESGMSTYDEMLKWGKRKNVTDIAEAATPCRNAGREPPKKSARGRNGHTSQHASSAMVEMCMQEPLDTYVKRLMELDPEVPRTTEQCVLMLSRIPKAGTNGKRLSVAESWHERRVIPMQARGMMKRVQKYEAGDSKKAFKKWTHGAGSDRIVPVDDFEKWVKGCRPGESIGFDMVQNYLQSFNMNACRRTVKNYQALAIALSGSATASAKYKQEARETAETSLRRVQAWATMICSLWVRPGHSHCRTAPSKSNDAIYMTMKALANKLHHDSIPFYTLHPGMFFNVDDVSTNLGSDEQKEVRAVPNGVGSGSYSKFKLDGQESTIKMTVHFTVLGSSSAFLAPVVMRIKVKPQEWQAANGDSLVIVQVPGLCRGGGTEVNNISVGYIVFVKNDGDKETEAVDQAFFRWYHSTIALPFIESTRQHVFRDYAWKPGADVPAGMEAVLLYDGGGPQRIALSEEEYLQMAAKSGVDGAKSNPNATSVEQWADVQPGFKILQNRMKKITVTHVSEGNSNKCDVLRQTAAKSIAAQTTVRLNPGRLQLLLNAVGAIPETFTEAFTPDRMRKGWVKSGIMAKDNSGPDLEKLYGTRKQQWTAEEKELCKKSFPEMVVAMAYDGCVQEATYDEYGFPKDTTWDGKVKERDVNTIINGGQARAERPSHPAKREARLNHLFDIARQNTEKHTKMVDDVQALLEFDKIATEQVREAVITEVKNSHLQMGSKVEILAEDDWWDGRIVARDGNKSVTVSFDGPASTEDMNEVIKFSQWSRRLRPRAGDTMVSDAESDLDWMNTRVQAKHFLSVRVSHLEAFIRVRQGLTPHDAPRRSLPPKNKRAEPGGDQTLLTMAYEVRNNPVIMQVPSPGPDPQTKRTIIPELCPLIPYQNDTSTPLASKYLNDPAWIQQIDKSLVGSPEVHTVKQADVSRADALVNIILRRLEKLVATRVPANKRNHWCLWWVHMNAGVWAAMATRKGHVKSSNFHGDTAHICLLTQKLNFFHKVQGDAVLFEGCYLYVFSPDDHDATEDGVVITRSGKSVSGAAGSKRSFDVRHTEHAKDALLDKKSGHSKFHRTYPRKEAPFMPTCKRGNFENLTQYVGMAWDPSDLNAVHAICDETENGIFEWPEAVLANLRADKWNNMNMQQKQLNMVGYLLEIFYDMALAPGDNVSENPGFERYLLDHSRANVQ